MPLCGRRCSWPDSSCVSPAAVAVAQRFGGRNRRPQLDVEVQGNTPYDGRFVFVRLRYSTGFGGWGNWIGDGGPPWSHDYPDGEVHFSKILDEITLPAHPDGRLEHPGA